jgi:hypothetical protein
MGAKPSAPRSDNVRFPDHPTRGVASEAGRVRTQPRAGAQSGKWLAKWQCERGPDALSSRRCGCVH